MDNYSPVDVKQRYLKCTEPLPRCHNFGQLLCLDGRRKRGVSRTREGDGQAGPEKGVQQEKIQASHLVGHFIHNNVNQNLGALSRGMAHAEDSRQVIALEGGRRKRNSGFRCACARSDDWAPACVVHANLEEKESGGPRSSRHRSGTVQGWNCLMPARCVPRSCRRLVLGRGSTERMRMREREMKTKTHAPSLPASARPRCGARS